MSTIESRDVILRSLNEMDNKQTDKVLEYIQSLLSDSGRDNYSHFKKKALNQINNALREV